MKKTILILVTLTLLFSLITLAAAPPSPSPIVGQPGLTLNGAGLTGYIIIVENLRTGLRVTGDTVTSLVTENGGFFVDLRAVDFQGPIPNIFPGDTIKVSVKGLTDPQATVSFIPTDTPYYFSIPIVSGQQGFQCLDGSFVINQNDCPAPPPPPPEQEEDEELPVIIKVSGDGETATMEAFYGQVMDAKIGDNKLSKLIDKEISYDGEKYDVKEEVLFKGIVHTSIDDKDFGMDPYLIIQEEDIIYKYIFQDKIEVSDFHIEEPLEITFLGREIKIIEASASEMIIRSGEELFLAEGDDETVEGKKVLVKTIGENSVAISVDGIEEIVTDGNDRKINGLHVLVENILYKGYEGGVSRVELIVGLETDETVKDGDDFELFVEDEEIWTWIIRLGEDPQWIGITNQEAYKKIDDEDYNAFGIGDSLFLPNNFMHITFDSVTDEDMADMDFKVREKDGNDYLYVKGDEEDAFSFGSTDYDRLYINDIGIYDEDLEFITDDKVVIGDSDTFLEMGSAIIRDLEILLDLADILFQGISFAGKDETYMDHFGIIFKDPENAVEDQDGFKVSVPEERPEVLITFGVSLSVPGVEPDDEEEEEETDVIVPVDDTPIPTTPIVPTTPVVPPVSPPVTPPVEPPITKYICSDGTEVSTQEECEVEEPESNLKTILITLIASIIGIFTWGKGFAGLIKYYLRLADETNDKKLAKKYRARAEKMAKTVVTNFLAGKYKK